MCLILPAFSSPDLKAFPLHLRHCRSSGSAPSLPNLPRACRARLCLPCQPSSSRLSAPPYRRQTLQPQTRHPSHQRWYVLLLSDCQCQWRKDPHLPYQPHPSATCRALRACPLWHLWPVSASASQTRKPSPNTIGPLTFARLGLITSPPSSPARRAFLGFIFSFGTDLIRSFFVTYVLKCCRAGCLLIVWFACSGSRLCGK